MRKLKILLQSNIFFLFLLFLVSIFVFVKTKVISYSTLFSSDIQSITAKIVSYHLDGDKLSFYLKEREVFVATYYIPSEEEKIKLEKELMVGLTIKIEGTSQEIFSNTIPNTFDYKKYLNQHQIYFSFLIQKITIMDEKISFFAKVKNGFEKRMQNLYNEPYLRAFILGDTHFIENNVHEMIQKNGVSHLLALSGMHLSFLSMFMDKVFSKIKGKKILIYSLFLFYLILTNFPISFLRAILFTFLCDINHFFSFNISKLKLLFFTAVILLFFNPFFLFYTGFLYTFVVTFAILFSNSCFKKSNKVMQMLTLSVITFLFSAPITIFNCYEINITSIFNNFLFIPFVTFLLFPLAMITFLFPFLLPIFSFFTSVLESLNSFLALFSFVLIVGKITILDCLLYYLSLIFLLKTKRKLFLFLFFLLVVFVYHKDFFQFSSYVTFLDVGQGDAILIRTSQNKDVVLIDTGGKLTYKKEEWQERDKQYRLGDTIIQYFKSVRIRSISSLILTHGDYDHMGEAINLVENFKVEKIIFNCGEFNDLEQDLIKVLNNKKIPYYSCIKELNIDDNKFYFLNNKEYGNENDNSSVIYTELNNYKFLFMGDAGIEVEQDLIKNYNLQNMDILKVGHHGSKTSSGKEFIDETNPKYSIISVGKNNRYGHPNDNVLENLEDTKIYRTDQDGSIIFKIKNNKLKIETCAP